MTAKQFAENKGYKDARPMRRWNGYICYEAIVHEPEDINDIPMIGFPQIILQKNGKCRMANYEEAMDIISGME